MKLGTVCTGIGSPEQALKNIGIKHEVVFGCEIDKYAKQTYLANFSPKYFYSDMTKEHWDRPEQYADLIIGGIPCQAFSLAGKRLGELDPRGLLFFDFHRLIKNQRPKAFIIENVKGLLSDSKGKTFSNWVHLLGSTLNTQQVMFPHEDSLGYNLHFKVLNSKDFGVPQNRERVFLVGIRPDLPNDFSFPVGWRLDKCLKDDLEPNVDEKYYLTDKMLAGFAVHASNQAKLGNGFKFEPITDPENEIASCVTARVFKMGPDDNYIKEVGQLNSSQDGRVFSPEGISQCLSSGHSNSPKILEEVLVSKEVRTEDAKAERRATGTNSFRGKELVFNKQEYMNCIQTGLTNDNLIMVKEATKQGYALAGPGDAINLSNPKSETRRGRVGKGIANTLDTACNQAVVEPSKSPELILQHTLSGGKWDKHNESCRRVYHHNGLAPTITTMTGGGHEPKTVQYNRIRRLTPLECFRLQGFPDSFVKPCSDTQTYKQAGNSITVSVIQAIIKNLLPVLSEEETVNSFSYELEF